MVKPDRELYEPPYDDALMYDTVEEPQGPRGRPLIVLLGIVVLAAFAGVVWVAYNQGVKEGQRSNPPILSAESGPTRIAPESSQAADASPSDKTMARLSGEAEAIPGEDQIMPAPEEPRPLPSPQDVAAVPPSASSLIAPPPSPAISAPSEARSASDHPGLDTTVSPVTPLPSGSQRMFSSQTTHAAPAPSASEDLTSALPPAEDSTFAAPPPAPKPTKPKPAAAAKPAALPELPPAVTSTTTVPEGEGGPLVPGKPIETASLEVPPTTSPPVAAGGPISIQLGSFPTDLLAASSWSKIKSSNVEVLGDYSPKFQRAVVEGKGTWYRLQVTGFADKASAQDVCNKLKANGQACIITTAK
jgi:hypothetical protein